MAIRPIDNGMSGAEAADIIQENDLFNLNETSKKLDRSQLETILDGTYGLISNENEFIIADADGNVVFRIDSEGAVEYNGIMTEAVITEKIEDVGILNLETDKFVISDLDGNVALKVDEKGVDFIGKEKNSNQSLIFDLPTLAAGATTSITTFPRFSKKGQVFNIKINVAALDSGYIEFGFGKMKYRGRYYRVTPTGLVPVRYDSSTPDVPANEIVGTEITHGLTITQFLIVSMYVDDSGNGYFTLTTATGQVKLTSSYGYEANNDPFVHSNGKTFSNLRAALSNKDFLKEIWGFGDSYFGVTADRWPGIMRSIGFFNWYINGLAGQSSLGALSDLKKALLYGTPKRIFWCLGMNDTDANYNTAYSELVEICATKKIELILATIPSVPNRNKIYISDKVRASGFRYVDFAKAVGADNSEGTWFEGMLNSVDLVHPTALGAKALAAQVLVDFPEIMQYGLVPTTSEIGNSVNDL